MSIWLEGLHKGDWWWAAVAACLFAGIYWHLLLLGVVVAVVPALVSSWRHWA